MQDYYNILLHYSQDIGAGKGKYYAVNFPLRDGIDDDSYEQIFNPVRISENVFVTLKDNFPLDVNNNIIEMAFFVMMQ